MPPAIRGFLALPLAALLGCQAPWDPLVGCAEFDACTTSTGSSEESTSADGVQTVTGASDDSSGYDLSGSGDDTGSSGDTTSAPVEPPPTWLSLTATPDPVMERGPLQIEAVTEHAAAIELWLDGVSLGLFIPEDGKVTHEVPIVFDGQDGEHVVDALASSPIGTAPDQVLFSVDLPPGGQDVMVPWLDQDAAEFSAAFSMARHGSRLVTVGILDLGDGWRLVLREHGAAGDLVGQRTLAGWTKRDDLLTAEVSGFGTGAAFDEVGNVYVAANVTPSGQTEPRGYLVGLTTEGGVIFPEILLAPGEEIEEIVVRDGRVILVGRKKVAGGRTVAVVWAFDTNTGLQAWAPILVDVPDNQDPKARSARFHGVTFTNDGNLLAAGSTQVKGDNNEKPTRALFLRVSPTGLQLGEPEVFGDQDFALQTAALAVAAFTGPDGFCFTGWTRDDDFDPELMVTYCRGESIVSRFTTAWKNSAGLSIAYTPLTRRIIVGGYRSGLGDGWVISFAEGGAPLESPHGWSWDYDSPAGGVDRVTAVACQTYDCDVLTVSDLLGDSQVRLGRLNQ